MAAKASFQLFPSPAKNKKNPLRTVPIRNESRSRSPIISDITDEFKGDIQTESVIIKIIEDTNSETIQARPATASLSSVSHSKTSSDTNTMQQPSQTQADQQSPVSPAQPIKSMFPQYNPQLPLVQQAYFPQNVGSSSSVRPRQDTAASQEMQIPLSEVDAVLGPKTVPASVYNFPPGALSPRIELSTAEDLVTLWESANGQELQETLGTFNLRVERYAIILRNRVP